MSAISGEEPYVVEEVPGMLKLLSNGTVIRAPHVFGENPYDDAKYPSITWRDITFDPVHNLQLRLYEPISDHVPQTILLYIHGGGFCLGSRDQFFVHNYCLRLADELGAVVVSVDYRLAPENRLPAAVEDCWTALKWIQSIWKEGQGVFVYGDSAGGTLAHHLAVQIASRGSTEIHRVQVKGYVLMYPGFGGVERTKSELDCPKDSLLNLDVVDSYYRLSLPLGETADHPMLNPFGPRSPDLKQLDLGPMIVMVGDLDILYDRAKDYASRLSNLGKKVEYVEFKGQGHAFPFNRSDPEPANMVLSLTKRFISENSGCYQHV